MQYLGSKKRICPWILETAKNMFPECANFLDLFAGTGIVSISALKNGYLVTANDFEPYAFFVLRSLIHETRSQIEDVVAKIEKLKKESNLLSNDRRKMEPMLKCEDAIFKNALNEEWKWKEYEKFCEETSNIDGSSQSAVDLKKKEKWTLFSRYYGNTYFGIRQCLQLDALRELAAQQPEHLKAHIIAACISAMTVGVSSTTHLAQYLRPSSSARALHLIKRRQFDFVGAVIDRLQEVKKFNIAKRSEVFQLDFRDLLECLPLDNKWIIYADPPYFKEHYSRYYHVLNTFCLYDYPALTYNPRLKRTTEGKYREDRNISDFGKKAFVKNAFRELFELCKQKGCNLILSYAETSLVEKKELFEIALESGLNGEIMEKTISHSAQGQLGNKKVIEYLFCLK
jgi:adenine-specific DNA-methyltransferase